MNANQLWQTFLETGSPEVYLLFNQARKLEDEHVPDDSRSSIACNQLQ